MTKFLREGRVVAGLRRSGGEIHMWLPQGWELPVVTLEDESVTVETDDRSRFRLSRKWFRLSGKFEASRTGRPVASTTQL